MGGSPISRKCMWLWTHLCIPGVMYPFRLGILESVEYCGSSAFRCCILAVCNNAAGGFYKFTKALYCISPIFIAHTAGMTHFLDLNASQSLIRSFENLKRKPYSCNACIYFNKQCLAKKLTPTYAKVKVPNTSPAHTYTQRKAMVMRIKDEVRYLHCKKQRLNRQIYQAHLQLADSWSGFWPHIQSTIEDKLQTELNT